MKILHIDAGITGPASVSRQLSQAIVERLRGGNPEAEVIRRDLDAQPVPHLDGRNISTLRPAADARPEGEAALSAEVLREFLEADVVVLGAPMYNFGIPSQLKAWFDRVLVAGQTFRYTPQGAEGLAGGKRVIIASARGGFYAEGSAQAQIDFHEPYLKALFRFIGIDEVTIVRAEGVAVSPELREAALASALSSAAQLPVAVPSLAA